MPPPATLSRVESSARPSPAAASGVDLLRGRLMQDALRAQLDRVRGARDALPHVAALEVALGQFGVAAVQRIPQQHLPRIHAQLRVLTAATSDAALQDLVERVRGALRAQRPESTHQLAPFDPEATVVITEGTHSDFMLALHELRKER